MKKGFSLIELMLVISLVLIILIAAFYVFNRVSINEKTNKVINEIGFLVSEYDYYHQYTKDDPSYDPTTNMKSNFPLLDKNESGYQNQKKYRSPFGGVFLYYFGLRDNKHDNLVIYLKEKNLKVDSCVKIAMSQSSLADEINTRGGSIKNVSSLTKNEILTKMIEFCGNMEKLDEQYLYFSYIDPIL